MNDSTYREDGGRVWRFAAVLAVVAMSGIIAVVILGMNSSAVWSTSCASRVDLISESTAEDTAIERALFNDFDDDGDDPTVTTSTLDDAASIAAAYDVEFGSSAGSSECVWYITLDGAVDQSRVLSSSGTYTDTFTIMEVGLRAIDGELLSEAFYTDDYTPEPSPTAATPTPLATPTSRSTPAVVPTP